MSASDATTPGTEGEDYAQRLARKQNVRWKKVLNVQAPYQWNLRRQGLGRVLDVGCGIGRNLGTLSADSVGVDHNERSVQLARERGVIAMTPEEFHRSDAARPGAFDGMLLAHVIEHLDWAQAVELVREYLPYLRPGAKVFFVCPQERGYASDPTHVRFVDEKALVELSRSVGLEPGSPFSFPFPRFLGKAFVYNEICLLARVPAASR